MAYQQKRREYFSNLRKDEKTANAGFGWTEAEEEQLILQCKQGLSNEEIAIIHKRTENSIRARLIDICIRDEEKSDELGISEEDIQQEKERREQLKKKREEYRERKHASDSNSHSYSSHSSDKNEKMSLHTLIAFKKFLKEKREMTHKMDSLFDEFIQKI